MELFVCEQNLTQVNSLALAGEHDHQPNQPQPKETENLAEGQGRKKKPIKEKLWNRLMITDAGCWEWRGARDRDGYGYLKHGGERLAHRVAWSVCYGPIPEKIQILHRCDNPPCCNPLHLFSGTPMDNMRDKMNKGRYTCPLGEDSPQAKLTTAEVVEIRRLHSLGAMSQRAIAKHFQVGYKAVNKIVLRQRWKHV